MTQTPKAPHAAEACAWCKKPVDLFHYHHRVGRNDAPVHHGACMDAWVADAPRRARLEMAAPELYEALRDLLDAAYLHPGDLTDAARAARAVLAKVAP